MSTTSAGAPLIVSIVHVMDHFSPNAPPPDLAPPKVVVLAGGFGTRLAEHTDETPKPLVEVGDRPILWHILKIYSHYGFDDFVIAGGYKADRIKRFFLEYREQMSDLLIDYRANTVERLSEVAGHCTEPWRVAIIDTGAETMTGGRVRRLRHHVGDRTFMLTYGDGVADVDLRRLLAFHRRHGRLVTFTAVQAPSQFGCPRLAGDRVVEFAEKPQDPDQWINGGYFVVEPEVMDHIDGDGSSFEMETLPRIAKLGQLMAYRHHGFWQPMDTLRDVRNLNRLWQQPCPPWKVWSDAASASSAPLPAPIAPTVAVRTRHEHGETPVTANPHALRTV